MMKRPLLLLLTIATTANARTLLDTRLSPTPPDFSAATQQKVIGDLMQWPTNKVCADASVQDMATGFFTQKAAKETVYIVQDCVQNNDGLSGKYWRMALYRGGKLQQVLTNAGDSIGNVGDINGDGLDDLVFIAYAPQEPQRRGVTFFTLAGGTFRRVLDLDEAAYFSCGASKPSIGNIRLYRVSVGKPATPPTFTIEQFKNKDENCDDLRPQAFTLVKKWIRRGK